MEGRMEDLEEEAKKIFPAILELACHRGYDSIIGSCAGIPQPWPVAPALVTLATLKSIVKSGQTERYGEAVPLLQHLHDEFPTAAAEGEEWVSAEMEYTELLVDLKTKAVLSQLLGKDCTSNKTQKFAVLNKFFDPHLCKDYTPEKGTEQLSSSPREYDAAYHAFARNGLEELILSEQKTSEFQCSNLLYPPQAMRLHRNMVTSLDRYLDKIRAQMPVPKILQWWKSATDLELETEGLALTADSHTQAESSVSELDHSLNWESPSTSPLSSVSSPFQTSESTPCVSPPTSPVNSPLVKRESPLWTSPLTSPHLPVNSPAQTRERPLLVLTSPHLSLSCLSVKRENPPLRSPPTSPVSSLNESPSLTSSPSLPHSPVSSPSHMREGAPLASPSSPPHLPVSSPPQMRESPPLASPSSPPHFPVSSPPQMRESPPLASPSSPPHFPVSGPSRMRESPSTPSSPHLPINIPPRTGESPSPPSSPHISIGSPSQIRESPLTSPSASSHLSIGSPSWTREDPPLASPSGSSYLSVGSPSWGRESLLWTSPPSFPCQGGEIDVMYTDEDDDSAVGTLDAGSPIVKPALAIKRFSIAVEKLQMPSRLQLRKQQAAPASITDEAPLPFTADDTLDGELLELAASPVTSSFQAVASSPVSSPFLNMDGNSVNSSFLNVVDSSDSISSQSAESDTTENEHRVGSASFIGDASQKPVSAFQQSTLLEPTDTQSPHYDALKGQLREKELSRRNRKTQADARFKRLRSGKLSVIPDTEAPVVQDTHSPSQSTSESEATSSRRRVSIKQNPGSLHEVFCSDDAPRSRLKRAAARIKHLVADQEVPIQHSGFKGLKTCKSNIETRVTQTISESEATGTESQTSIKRIPRSPPKVRSDALKGRLSKTVTFRTLPTVHAVEKKEHLSHRRKKPTMLVRLEGDHDVPWGTEFKRLRTGKVVVLPGTGKPSTSESEATGSHEEVSIKRNPRSSRKVFRSNDTLKGRQSTTEATAPPVVAATGSEISSRVYRKRTRLELLVDDHDALIQVSRLRTGRLQETPDIQTTHSPTQSSSASEAAGTKRRISINREPRSSRKMFRSSAALKGRLRRAANAVRKKDFSSRDYSRRTRQEMSVAGHDEPTHGQGIRFKRLRTGKMLERPITHSPTQSTSSTGSSRISFKRKRSSRNLDISSSSGSGVAKNTQRRKRRRLQTASPLVTGPSKSWLDTVQLSGSAAHPNDATPDTGTTEIRQTEGSGGFDTESEKTSSDEYLPGLKPSITRIYTFRKRKRKPVIELTDRSISESDSEQEGYNHERVIPQPESQPKEINLMDDEIEASQAQSQYDYTAIQRAALDTASVSTETIVSESGISGSPVKSPILRRLKEIPLR